ncbi:serine/threonine-protein kinase [Streptomyces sp. NPDC015127]|uniref:serine/threonine-protein kinase n=1 Tax=Streptomyces sp. NPDC015127 TaxID=3364939 RepID=UPI0036F8E702
MDVWGEPVRVGDVLRGVWELTSLLGKGGMAEVWSAVDIRSGNRVAVKFLRPDTEDLRHLDALELQTEIEALRGRFRREAGLLRELRHPGIPEFFGEGTHLGLPYFVMRLVEGKTLHTFLTEHAPLPPSSAAAVAAQVADALVCAHTKPLVHRDLKPHNIMLAADGSAVLIDFGIAKPLETHATSYTRQGSTLGSRGYQAPEQILAKEPTTRTDIYALGCICYKLFTGSRPFVAADDHTLNDMHLKKEPLAPSLHGANVPPDLDDLILRMLAKAPQDRPVAEAVRQAFRSLAPRPGDPAPRPRLVPDPTAPFRLSRRAERLADTGFGDTCSGGEEEDQWLDGAEVEELYESASAEVAAGKPAEAVRRLAGLAARARDEWGVRRPLVARVWQVAADGLRLAGECGEAATLYDGLAGGLGPVGGDEGLLARATARLRAAECRLAFGQLDAAVRELDECRRLAMTLPETLARQLTEVCDEVAVDIDERVAGPEAS